VISPAARVLANPNLVEAFTIRRPTPAMQEGVETVTNADIAASGSLQPAKPADLQGLPEGQRLAETIAVWTTTEVKADPGAPDELLWSGRTYRVVALERWPDHYRALAQRVLP
jgi:hypothetical protein